MGEVEKGCGCVEGIGGLSNKAVRIRRSAELFFLLLYTVSPRHLIGLHCAFRTIKGLLRKLLDVGLACCIVHDGIVIWAL